MYSQHEQRGSSSGKCYRLACDTQEPATKQGTSGDLHTRWHDQEAMRETQGSKLVNGFIASTYISSRKGGIDCSKFACAWRVGATPIGATTAPYQQGLRRTQIPHGNGQQTDPTQRDNKYI